MNAKLTALAKTMRVVQTQAQEIRRLRGCILWLYRELGKAHPLVCFDPDCDGTCGDPETPAMKHPFEWEKGGMP